LTCLWRKLRMYVLRQSREPTVTSPARIAANRRNSRFSTGPRSLEGKAVSSVNAVRHGILSRQPLLADEDPAEYELLNRRLVEAYSPVGAAEELHLDEVVGLAWRLRRAQRVEVALFSIGMPRAVAQALLQAGEDDASIGAAFSSQASAFGLLSRYETSLVSRLHRALAHLERLQSEREADEADIVVIPGGL